MVLHHAVLGPSSEKTCELVKYLVEAHPAALEAKNSYGDSPLMTAAWVCSSTLKTTTPLPPPSEALCTLHNCFKIVQTSPTSTFTFKPLETNLFRRMLT